MKNSKGSALLVTLLFTIGIGAAVGSLLKLNIMEHRNTERFAQNLEAQNATEAIIQQGIADLYKRWSDGESPSLDELDPSNNPLSINPQLSTIYTNTSIDVSSLEIVGDTISNPTWINIDENDPANQFDPQKGKSIYARNLNIYAKSEADTAAGDKIGSYAQITFQLRDIPILTHAVFYNMDLEFHPGPDMHVTGPVHANGDIYADGYYSGQGTYFHNAVTTAGKYYHGFASYHIPGYSGAGEVFFKDADGNWVTDYKGAGLTSLASSYYDSTYIHPVTQQPDWAAKASELFDGNLQSKEHGVQKLSITGFKDYVRDNPDTGTIDDDLNYAYALIEPNLKVKDKLNHPDYKNKTEKEKFAYKSGLIIRVHNQSAAPSSLAHQVSSNYWVTFHHMKRQNINNPFSDPDITGNSEVEEYDLKVKSEFITALFNMEEYAENWGMPTAGFWDPRRQKGISTLEFDMDEFRKGVDDTHPDYKGQGSGAYWENNTGHKYKPDKDYNGVVYFEFPFSTSASGRADNIVTSTDGLGLVVTNAETIPKPSFNDATGRTQGFTLATNNTVYLKGHFNADGNSGTGSNTDPDSSSNPEPPAAIAADSITLLSNNFVRDYTKWSDELRKATFTEVNAALFQGIVPSDKGGANNQSGGNHNFIRLIEDWDNVTLTYRGAMICMFESELGDEMASGSYYDPPYRNFGYYSEFGNGNFPPGVPFTRTFELIDFRYLTKDEYDAKVAGSGN